MFIINLVIPTYCSDLYNWNKATETCIWHADVVFSFSVLPLLPSIIKYDAESAATFKSLLSPIKIWIALLIKLPAVMIEREHYDYVPLHSMKVFAMPASGIAYTTTLIAAFRPMVVILKVVG